MNSCTKKIIKKQLTIIKEKYNNEFYMIPENFIKKSINELKIKGGQNFSDKYVENLYNIQESKESNSEYINEYIIERKVLFTLWKDKITENINNYYNK